jgi:predicted DNA-binding protein with PD1-like motif
MRQVSFRLRPGALLKEEIEGRAVKEGIKAGVLLSVVGGLDNAVLRMAGSDADNQKIREWTGPFEIVSGTGTISDEGCHLHVSFSDEGGQVVGGHLRDGCVVKYTAEIVLGVFGDVAYRRVHDDETGFRELEVEHAG